MKQIFMVIYVALLFSIGLFSCKKECTKDVLQQPELYMLNVEKFSDGIAQRCTASEVIAMGQITQPLQFFPTYFTATGTGYLWFYNGPTPAYGLGTYEITIGTSRIPKYFYGSIIQSTQQQGEFIAVNTPVNSPMRIPMNTLFKITIRGINVCGKMTSISGVFIMSTATRTDGIPLETIDQWLVKQKLTADQAITSLDAGKEILSKLSLQE